MGDPGDGPRDGESGAAEGGERLGVLFPSSIGELGVELLGGKVCAVAIAPGKDRRARFHSFAELEPSELLDEVVGQFSEFLAGARRRFSLEVDLAATGVTGFNRRVLKETGKVRYGRTRSYQEIAKAAGQPEGYRLVLSALMANPVPLIIPCHRVVTNKSGPGSYLAGSERKEWLLEMEAGGVPPGELGGDG